MFVYGIQTEEEAKKIEGTLYDNPMSFGFKDVLKWNNTKKYMECVDAVKDTSKVAVDGTIGEYVPFGFCRKCKQQIKPYKEIFYQKRFEYAHWWSWMYCQENGYCRACAIAISKEKLCENHPLYETSRVNSASPEYAYEKRTFSDGSEMVYTTLGNKYWYRDTEVRIPKYWR